MQVTDRPAQVRRGAWLPAAALLALFVSLMLGPAPGLAEDEKDEEPKGREESAPPAAGKPSALMARVREDPKEFKDYIEDVRRYFDLDEELWKGRKQMLNVLGEMADKGEYPLKDMEFLRWTVYQGRNFEPDMTDRKWQRSRDINEAKSLAGTLYWMKSENLTITFSVPRKYPKLKKLRTRFPRIEPYPLLLTMHERQDYTNQRFPGEVLAKRRFPKETWEELYERWIILIPEAAAGNFLEADGQVRIKVFKHPYSVFWKHYHVDFERVILDGSEQALAVATSMPVFFAGIVFRGKWKLETAAQKASVRNFAPVPVYVVDNPELAKQLREAGHTSVTAGISGPVLFKWMEAQRRTTPRKFEWTVERFDEVLPYWVNLDSVKWGDPNRELKVEVVDTEEEPNTIKMEARGISELSLYLNDEIVDLDRKVRVVINKNLEHDALLEPDSDKMKKVGRDLDLLFNREPVRVRESMFFGWLKSARVVRLTVRPPPVKKEPDKPKQPVVTKPKATPEQERRAERLWQKAESYASKGQTDEAIRFLKMVLELPENKRTGDAKKKLDELESQ